MNRPRRWLGRLLLASGSVLVTVLLIDATLFLVKGPVRLVENFYEPDAACGYRMRPHLAFEFAHPFHGYRATVHTNALGLRGPDVSFHKPPGTRRILFLGDSITAGLEVDDEDTFAAVCGQNLGGPAEVDVINAGIRGYNLDNITAWLRSTGMRLEPDVVVYTFVDNDWCTDSTWAPARGDWSRGPKLHRVVRRIAAYSHLLYRFELLRERQKLRAAAGYRVSTARPGAGVADLLIDGDLATRPGAIPTARRIAALDSIARAGGARFVLAGAPHRLEVSPEAQAWLSRERHGAGADPDACRRWLDAVAVDLGCGRVDPVPEFRAEAAHGADFWFHEDDHLNVRGHRLFADILTRELRPLTTAVH